MELSDLCDSYWRKREERLALKKEVDKLEEEEKQLKEELIKQMHQQSLTAAGGKLCKYELKEEEEPNVADWQEFYAYVRKTGEFDLLYRRLNPAAVKERLKDNVQVPGVGWFPVEKLSYSRIK